MEEIQNGLDDPSCLEAEMVRVLHAQSYLSRLDFNDSDAYFINKHTGIVVW